VRVRFTPQAAKQYLDALRKLHAENAAGAATVQQRTEAVVELLREHPNAGHAIAEFPDLPHRELSAPPYRVFYRVASDTVWIVAVVHARRRPDPPESDSRD
jgi:plasmid stabilization system protein ParE